MKSRLALLAVPFLALACSDTGQENLPTAPPPRLDLGNPSDDNPARGSVFSSVVGDGVVLVGATPRDFSFNALDQRGAQGTRKVQGAVVTGQFTMFDPTTGGRVHGIVTCFLITGNGARIGGQVTQPPPANGVVEVGWQVLDAATDQMSDLITHGAGAPGNAAQTAFCNGEGVDPALADIVSGDIKVQNHPPSS